MKKAPLLSRLLLCSLVLLLLVLIPLSLPVRAAEPGASAVHWQDYNGKRIGILTGTLMEQVAKDNLPDSQYFYYNSYPDCITALLTGKIDGFLGDEPALKSIRAEQPEIGYVPERIVTNQYSFAFRKGDPKSAALCQEVNDFLAQCRADGTLQEIDDVWFGADESRKLVDMSGLTGENGTIRVITTSTDMPFSYIKDGLHVGYDIDVVVRFCRARGYALDLGDGDFSARLPAIQSGKYDFTTAMNVTPERQEEVLFSDPVSSGGVVVAVLAKDLPSSSLPTVDDLADRRIGVITGAVHDSLVAKRLPTAQLVYYTGASDLLTAMKTGKIDAFVVPESNAIFMSYEDDSITWLKEHLLDGDLGFAFPKTDSGRAHNEQFSAMVRRMKADGSLQSLVDKWFSADESAKAMPDYTALPADNGTLTMATTASQIPYDYVRDNKIVGFEVELATLFCRENGYALKVEDMNFDGILASVQSGKCDFGANCLVSTPERREKVDFSESYHRESVVFVVPDPAKTGEVSLLESIRTSFEKTFIREDRWKLFLEGVGTTLLITVSAILLGTALGFGAYMTCRGGNPIANGVTRFLVWLVHGMPVVVLLMILYYILFASTPIDGAAVAIIGFTLVFGSAVYAMLQAGVAAVDYGQTEAAYALGYGSTRAFFRVVLPQAVPHFFPAYKGEITSLIKATAVVGYIAVQDLTKMGDIIRGRTYEAFFPLIAVAVIYFLLAGILTFLAGRLELCLDPKRRKKETILKGVTTHD